MDYNVTREQAAEMLNISTRTLDRWIRNGRLSHSKDSNKVMLAEEEVKHFEQESKDPSVVVAWQSKYEHKTQIAKPESWDLVDKLSKKFDQQTAKFLEILNAKDLKIEHKNQVIMSLQQRVFEAENRLKHTIALPLHQEKHQEILKEKEHLEFEKNLLEDEIQSVKIKNIALIWTLIVLIIILILVSL